MSYSIAPLSPFAAIAVHTPWHNEAMIYKSSLLVGVVALILTPALALAQATQPCVVLSHSLGLNSTDEATGGDVSALQNFLKQFPDVYPDGLVTGFFGPLTEKAVQEYQKKMDIVMSGDPESTGFGFVGPATRAKMALGCAAQSAIVPFSISVTNDAPVSLAPGSIGTWHLNASGGTPPYTFLVSWDDGQTSSLQTSTTFTHAFNGAGTYRPLFAGRDSLNRQASVGAPIVTVGTNILSTTNIGQTSVQTQSGSQTNQTQNANTIVPTKFPPTCTMSISPTKIKAGESATLTWSASNATSAAIPEIGPINASGGSKTVAPDHTITYTATFLGSGESTTCSATITVDAPQQVIATPNGTLCGLRDLKCESVGLENKVMYGDESLWSAPFSTVFLPASGEPYYAVTQRSRDGLTFNASPTSWGANVPCEGKEIEVLKCGQHSNTNFVVPEDIVCPSGYTGYLMSTYLADVDGQSSSQQVYEMGPSVSFLGTITKTYKHLVTCVKGVPAPKPNKCANLEISKPECR